MQTQPIIGVSKWVMDPRIGAGRAGFRLIVGRGESKSWKKRAPDQNRFPAPNDLRRHHQELHHHLLTLRLLCFQELYILLQRIQTFIEASSKGSRMWLLLQTESLATSFLKLTLDLSNLLDNLFVKEPRLNDDVEEVIFIIRTSALAAAQNCSSI